MLCAGGVAAPMALLGAKGEVLFQKRTSPFESPKRKDEGSCPSTPLTLAVCGLKSCTRCAIGCSVRGFATGSYISSHFATAPYYREARLRDVTTRRRSMAKPCTPHPIAQRVQLFKPQTGNVGGRGALPSRSLGGSRGPFSHVREWPPYCALPHAGNSRPSAGQDLSCQRPDYAADSVADRHHEQI